MSNAAPAIRPVSRLGFGSPRLNDYFGAWAIDAGHAAGLVDLAGRMNLRLHVARVEGEWEADAAEQTAGACGGGPAAPSSNYGSDRGETLAGDTAVIRISGTMMKFQSSMSSGTSTVAVRRMVRRAQADPAVGRVMLVIDSPGGTVAGTQDLADDVAALAAAKPTAAYVEDLCCSAAMWVASQCGTISAGRASLVGSIGAVMAVTDYSKWAARKGIKVHVVTSTGAEAFKGAGAQGAKVTDAQLAEWKAKLDGLNAHFLAAVAGGRGMTDKQVRELADGRVHLAAEAQKFGLVDQVESMDAAFARLRNPNAKPAKRSARSAIDPLPAANATVTAATTEQPAAGTDPGKAAADGAPPQTSADATGAKEDPPIMPAATVPELQKAFPAASSDFLIAQAVAGATIEQAKDAFIEHQAAQIRARDADLEKARAAKPAEPAATPTPTPTPTATVTAPAARKPGVPALESEAGKKGEGADAGDGTARGRFEALVEAKVAGGMARDKAVSAVARANPALQQQAIDEATVEHRARNDRR